ncbi:MAG: hypothetical protein K940chlam9_00637 [Chlamydiae bacterium]|nr:hypothetical protein [Chlamydiota bacterium]
MHLIETFYRLVSRFRYPVSLPEEVASDLGLHVPNSVSFQEFIQYLSSPEHRPTKLRRDMPRILAESAFESALKKESFKSCSFFSYYFNKSWLVFALHYDPEGRLRRVYLQCPNCISQEGFDIPI